MHNITYISDSDRIRLVELNEAVRSCETIEEQQAIRTEIAELEAKRKPLHECNMDETTELRTFVWDKFERLNRAGKYHLAQQFKVVLSQIELRQMVLHREMSEAEAKRLQEKKKRVATETNTEQSDSERDSTSTTKSGATSSRWTTGIGSLD